jgi:hypothetical protein
MSVQTKMQSYRKYIAKNPWAKFYSAAESRCTGKKQPSYLKGIRNLMRTADFKYLWFRDKAWLLTEPSIDRIDSKGHYVLENCRFIELQENLRRPKSTRLKVRQLTLDGKLVKIWESATEAQKWEGFRQNYISRCCRGLSHTHSNFKWEYIND